MKISFAPSERGISARRVAFDSLANFIARAWISDDDPNYPGEVMDVRVRYSVYGDEDDAYLVSPWNMETATRTSPDITLIIDRLHIY